MSKNSMRGVMISDEIWDVIKDSLLRRLNRLSETQHGHLETLAELKSGLRELPTCGGMVSIKYEEDSALKTIKEFTEMTEKREILLTKLKKALTIVVELSK